MAGETEVVLTIRADDDASGDVKKLIKLLRKQESQIEENNKKTRTSTRQTKQFGGAMLRAGLQTELIVRSVTALARGLAGLTKSFIGTIGAAADMGNEAAKVSQRVGVAADEFMALNHAANVNQIEQETLTDGLKELNIAMSEAKIGSERYTTAFAMLGMEMGDAPLPKTSEMLGKLANKFSDMEDETKKAFVAEELLGEAGSKLIPILNKGADGIEELKEEAREMGIVMSKEMIARSEEYKEAQARMNASVKGFKNQVGGAMMPAATAAMNAFRTLTSDIDLNTEALREMAFDALDGLIVRLIGAAEWLDKSSKPLLVLGKLFGVALPNAIEIFGNTLEILVGGALVGMVNIINKIVEGWLALINLVGKAAVSAGADELAESLRGVARSAASTSLKMEQMAENIEKSNKSDVRDLLSDVEDIEKSFEALSKQDESMSKGLRKIIEKLRKARKQVQKEREKSVDVSEPERPGVESRPTGEGEGEEEGGDEEEVTKFRKLKLKIMQKERALMREEDELSRALLQNEKQRLQNNLEFLESDRKAVDRARLQNKQLRNRLELEKKIKKIRQEAAAEPFEDFSKAASASGAEVSSSFAKVADMMAKVKRGEEKMVAAFGASGQAIATFADKLGASAQAQAGILAAFETAMGLATAFTNPAESVGHFAAAANFALIATGVIKKEEGGSSLGGNKSGGGKMENPEDAMRSMAEILRRVLQEGDKDTERPIQQNIYLNGTHVIDDPKSQVELGKAAAKAAETKINPPRPKEGVG